MTRSNHDGLKDTPFTTNLPDFVGRGTSPQRALVACRHLSVRTGEIERVVDVAGGVASGGDTTCLTCGLVIPRNLETA